jgi:Myb/SANT-like DNA-binding domain
MGLQHQVIFKTVLGSHKGAKEVTFSCLYMCDIIIDEDYTAKKMSYGFQKFNNGDINCEWSLAMDSLLVDCLVNQYNNKNWFIDDEHNTCAVMAARSVVVSHFSVKLAYHEVSQRVKYLRRRYLFFQKIVRTPEVTWDKTLKTVQATEEQWWDFWKEDPELTDAYVRGEEPLFDKMSTIFMPRSTTIPKSRMPRRPMFNRGPDGEGTS